MTTDLILLGTAGGTMPVAGRAGTSSAALGGLRRLHTDVTEIADIAGRAQVGELILTHFLPADPTAIDDDTRRRRAAADPRIRITADHDGLHRTLPSEPT